MEYRKKGLAFQHAKPFLNSDFLFQKRDQSVGKACHTGHRLNCLAVLFIEADQDIVVCFGQIIDNTVDIGLAQLAMHSAFETAGAKDTEYLVRSLCEFYSRKMTENTTGYLV